MYTHNKILWGFKHIRSLLNDLPCSVVHFLSYWCMGHKITDVWFFRHSKSCRSSWTEWIISFVFLLMNLNVKVLFIYVVIVKLEFSDESGCSLVAAQTNGWLRVHWMSLTRTMFFIVDNVWPSFELLLRIGVAINKLWI